MEIKAQWGAIKYPPEWLQWKELPLLDIGKCVKQPELSSIEKKEHKLEQPL